MTEQRNHFKFVCGPSGHRAICEMNGETMRGVTAITMSADLNGITTVTVRYINCDIEFEVDGFHNTDVTDITDDCRRYVRIPVAEVDGMSNEDFVRRVRSEAGMK